MSFKRDFQMSFESADLVAPISLDITSFEAEEIRYQQVEDELALSQNNEDKEYVKQIGEVRHCIVGVHDNVTLLKDVSPALMAPAVTTVNEQIVDTARTLGVEAPAPLTLTESHTVDEVSLEGVMDWIGKLFSSFSNSLRKVFLRIKVRLNRIGDSSKSYNKRIARCYTLLSRRKNEAGGNDIKLKPKYLGRLIQSTAVSTDLIASLNDMTSITNEIINAYKPIISDIQQGLERSIATAITGRGRTAAQNANIDKATLSTIAALEKRLLKEQTLFLGNTRFTSLKTYSEVPRLALVDSTPDAEYIARSIETVPSLGNEDIRQTLMGLQKIIDGQMVSLEEFIDGGFDEIENIYEAVQRLQSSIEQQPGIGTFSTVGQLENFSKRIEEEIEVIYDDTLETIVKLFERYSAVIAYAEESLLQD